MTTGYECGPSATDAAFEASAPTGNAPVFLLASYRSGSTWLWQKMRGLNNTLAYYEIFHQNLATLTIDKAKRLCFDSWPSHHPQMTAYFLEFVPLIDVRGGVAGFDADAMRNGFIPGGGPDGDLSAIEEAYVERLVADAQSKRKVPFLSCTGSLGRARALRKSFGGKAILLHRNLFYQWASCCTLADAGAPFFLDTIAQSYRGAAHVPFFRDVATWLGIDGSAACGRDALFPAFVLQHLYLYAVAYDSADVVVGLNEIAADKAARERAERDLSELMAREIDLSDARHESAPSASFEAPPRLRETVEQLAKLIPGTLMSDAAAGFVAKACQNALGEWERHDFHTRRVRTVLVGKVEAVETRLAAETARCNEATADKDRIVDELTEAFNGLRGGAVQRPEVVRAVAAEGQRLREVLRATLVEADASRRRIAQVERELADARGRLAAVTQERDATLASLAATEAERNALREDLANAVRDRDARALDARTR